MFAYFVVFLVLYGSLHFLFIVVRLLLWNLWTGSVVSCCTGLVYNSVRVSESFCFCNAVCCEL